jgi:hypothetical protein
MRRLLVAFLTLLFCAVPAIQAAQDARPADAAQGGAKAKPAVKRGPVFRSTKEQIKQAQVMWN